ncbi:hypothetical protein QL285_036046 [Trifolium repens]|nr:hypothetical protein QL285_036046 [Trifolium repens]
MLYARWFLYYITHNQNRYMEKTQVSYEDVEKKKKHVDEQQQQQQQNQHETHAGYNTKIFSRGGVFKKVSSTQIPGRIQDKDIRSKRRIEKQKIK